jgi:hypothetical protein
MPQQENCRYGILIKVVAVVGEGIAIAFCNSVSCKEISPEFYYMFEQSIYWYIIAAVVAVIILLMLFSKRLSEYFSGRKVRRQLRKMGVRQLRNVSCPDGLGHSFVIDYLVLCPDGISLVMYKPYAGIIYCAEKIELWTQMLGNKSYRFPNPLPELDYQLKSVASCVPGVQVKAYLFFDEQASFPKGQPVQVIQSGSMPESLLCGKKATVTAGVKDAWQKLTTMTKS